ncbi:MAG: hypothetical protein OXT03_02205 [Alphaproteobacteria bacterium]|nr:hypothetical protein [Alphaproteobacteria bacterium]
MRRWRLDISDYFWEESTETVSAEEFLKILETRRHTIESTRFIPPKLGDKHFGKFEIKRRVPYYEKTPYYEVSL